MLKLKHMDPNVENGFKFTVLISKIEQFGGTNNAAPFFWAFNSKHVDKIGSTLWIFCEIWTLDRFGGSQLVWSYLFASFHCQEYETLIKFSPEEVPQWEVKAASINFRWRKAQGTIESNRHLRNI